MNSGHETTAAELQGRVDRAREIRELTQHPGWPELLAALEERARNQMKVLMRKVSDSPAAYAHELGKCEGLESVGDIARHAIENGESAAAELRNRTGAEEASA